MPRWGPWQTTWRRIIAAQFAALCDSNGVGAQRVNGYGRVVLILVDEPGYLQLDRRGCFRFSPSGRSVRPSRSRLANRAPLDNELHRPAAVRRDCRQVDVRRDDHRNWQHLPPPRPRPRRSGRKRSRCHFNLSAPGHFKLTLRRLPTGLPISSFDTEPGSPGGRTRPDSRITVTWAAVVHTAKRAAQ